MFRSLTVTDAPDVSEEIEELVSRDALAAVDKEEGRVGKKLYYGFTVFHHGMTITGIYSIGILWSRLAAKEGRSDGGIHGRRSYSGRTETDV